MFELCEKSATATLDNVFEITASTSELCAFDTFGYPEVRATIDIEIRDSYDYESIEANSIITLPGAFALAFYRDQDTGAVCFDYWDTDSNDVRDPLHGDDAQAEQELADLNDAYGAELYSVMRKAIRALIEEIKPQAAAFLEEAEKTW